MVCAAAAAATAGTVVCVVDRDFVNECCCGRRNSQGMCSLQPEPP
jgi:hypothetical protein